MTKRKLFGYWIVVDDEESAKAAVQMSGLPVLLLGANSALFALIALVQPNPNHTYIVSSAVFACLMILMAFRIRSGHARWVTIAFFLYIAFFGVNLFFFFVWWRVVGQSAVSAIQLVLGWIVPLICLALVFGGLRGWRWLRANGAKTSA